MAPRNQTPTAWWQSPVNLLIACALGIMSFFLLTEHTAHVLGALPYLLLLMCPLMHLFMHHGRHHGGGHSHDRGGEEPRR
ncbi:MAG: DUF2933 domain-containing protein [Proteobacteria bacterium]|nr:DUF2933 domain-containing protein [Pseudomonadota bacterium]